MIESKNPEHLKAIAVKNTWSTILAYLLPVCGYGGIAVATGLSQAGMEQFLILWAYTIFFAAAVVGYIKTLKDFRYEDGLRVLIIQVANWYLCFGWWLVLLENGRAGGLIFANLMFIYTYAYTNIRKTIIGNLIVVTIYLAVSYYAIYHQQLSGNFIYDLYLIVAYLPVGVTIAKVGGQLSRQKYQLKRYAKEQSKTQEQLKNTLEKLEQIASTDDLTGLLNRREMNSRLAYEFKKLNRSELVMSVLILDLDYFKTINDKYGHACGDIVLIQVAKILQSEFRETDSIARWGGEEFLVLMPATSAKQAYKVSQRVLKKIANEPIEFEGNELMVTASGGICEIDRDGNLEQSIKAADDLLYKAKASGRNQVLKA